MNLLMYVSNTVNLFQNFSEILKGLCTLKGFQFPTLSHKVSRRSMVLEFLSHELVNKKLFCLERAKIIKF